MVYGKSIANISLDMVEEEYGISTNLGGEPFKDTYDEKEVKTIIEKYKRTKKQAETSGSLKVWQERNVSENFTSWGENREYHFANRVPMNQNFYRHPNIVIDILQPTDGTESVGMPTIVNTGIPIHKTWELMIGNTEVFKDPHESDQEIVILLDHSASMMGEEIGIAWSVAKTIKNTYENTEIYPYSDWGIYTGQIGDQQEIPNLCYSGTPTNDALLWVAEKYYDRLERTNIILVTDDDQYGNTGDLTKYMRETMGVRLGVICVGEEHRGSYSNFPKQFYSNIEKLGDLDKLQSVINIVTLEE